MSPLLTASRRPIEVGDVTAIEQRAKFRHGFQMRPIYRNVGIGAAGEFRFDMSRSRGHAQPIPCSSWERVPQHTKRSSAFSLGPRTRRPQDKNRIGCQECWGKTADGVVFFIWRVFSLGPTDGGIS